MWIDLHLIQDKDEDGQGSWIYLPLIKDRDEDYVLSDDVSNKKGDIEVMMHFSKSLR